MSRPTPELATLQALLFALSAERLAAFYDHGQFLSAQQADTLAGLWLPQAGINLSSQDRKSMLGLSQQFAEQLANGLSRELGVQAAYEMKEACDPAYQSPLSDELKALCRQLLLAAGYGDN